VENLIFAGVPLGPVVSGFVEIAKALFGEAADKAAVWINLVLSIGAFLLVFLWQQGQIPTDTEELIVMVLGILTTFFASAGTYDLVGNLGKTLGVK